MTRLSAVLPARAFELPLQASFRGLTARQGVVFQGPGGWGEFSPFADYDASADARWLVSAVAAATGLGVAPPRRDSVPVNAILPSLPAPQTGALARRAVTAEGCTTIKLKVAADGLDDLARVRAVRQVLTDELAHGHGHIRLDANGAWSVEEALEALELLVPLGIEYVEQPCATVAELRRLRAAEPGVPIAADESIRRDRQLAYVPSFADIAVLKVSPVGGPREVTRLVEQLGVPVVISGALESSVGLAQDIAVAAGLPDPVPACGFGTGMMLAADLVAEPVIPLRGEVPVSVVTPDEESLARAEARLSPTDAQAWLERLDRAWDTALAGDLVAPEDLAALGLA